MPAPAEALLDRVAPAIRANLPPGVTPAYFDGFLRRNRPQLVAILDQHLRARRPRSTGEHYVEATEQPPDLWSASQRTAANLAAMRLAARKRPDEMSPADRQTLAAYSGWGGLSITSVASQFPTGFPVPEDRGLIHEYYTPTKVSREVARVIKPLLPDLPRTDGHLLTLEPSAGIGRFVQAASGPGFEDLRWHVVEWSALSSRMLAALRPDVDLTQGPFERWVREHGPDVAGRIGLVLANPPYGQRGAAVTEDPDRGYREKAAYAYFLRRALDLLAPNGLGVFLVPAGFVSGGSDALRSLREKVLLRHHLASAYRLPSTIFPGAMLVTDLLFFRARGGALTEVDVADRSILDGRYFLDHPEHVLGTEVGKDAGDDDQTRKPRWGYQVVGTFERLPDLHERPICDACTIDRNVLVFPGASKHSRPVASAPEGLSETLATAYGLGQRVDRYLAALSAQTTDEHVQLWPELVEALGAWTKAHGNPWSGTDLRVAASGQRPFERFLQAFTRSGALIAGLATRPTWTPRYAGRPDDLVALAEWVYRTQRHLTLDTLAAALPNGGRADVMAGLPGLLDAGWCLDGDGWDELVPERDYLTGHLWPKHQRAVALSEKHEPKRVLHGGAVWGVVPLERVATQARRLIDTIAPAVLDDITGVSPRQGWVPLDLVSSWLSEALNRHYGAVRLERREGLVQVPGVDYDRIEDASDLSAEARWCVGWINHDRTTFSPKKRKDENIDEVRLKWAREWEQAFRAWVAADPSRAARVEHAYNQHFKGFVAPTYDAEPLPQRDSISDSCGSVGRNMASLGRVGSAGGRSAGAS